MCRWLPASACTRHVVAALEMTHRRAVALMVLVTLLWSIAGVVTRQLEVARSFEVTFWRSAFNALALVVALSFMRGPGLWRGLLQSGRVVWLSGACWAVIFSIIFFVGVFFPVIIIQIL